MNHPRTWGGELDVDLVAVRGDQRVVAVEVKLTAAVADRDVRRLRRLGDRIGPQLLSAAGPANACPRCDNGTLEPTMRGTVKPRRPAVAGGHMK